ncbi:MAG: phosphate ABC transporter substrate-binding protein [Phycisphaerae bacterium]|jgi:phosphate transport system substrate-binding protein
MKKTYVWMAFILISTAFFAGCGKVADSNDTQGTIQIKGSDTLVNAAQKVSEEFMKTSPGVFVSVTGGGSGVGVASLISKSCDIASASREMMPKEIEQAKKQGVFPKEIPVAHDGVALIINKNNQIDKLTINDLHNIFTGKAKNWKEFGGKDIAIVTLSREVSSGTYAHFKEEVIQLGDKKSTMEFSPQTLLLSSSQAIVEEAANNEGAIGYLGMGYLSDRTKTISVARTDKFFPPNAETVRSGEYPLSRLLYFYTNGEPKGAVKQFIDFTLSPAGQKQFSETGFVPLGVAGAEKTQ